MVIYMVEGKMVRHTLALDAPGCILASMSAERRYQLQYEEANRPIDALLERLRVPEATWRLYGEMLTTALKMFEDGAEVADLKIANSALKELRYGFKVFAPYRSVPKVTVFGSARTPPDHPVSAQARSFGKRMTESGWMVITGAGSGVMGAAQEGAGRERSFGLNIRLPFEQEANPWIADDPKLIRFKYFFTRKLFLVREAWAMAFFPGGFGTGDEVFETLTLIQTGKAESLPVVLVDAPGGSFWRRWVEFVREQMVGTGMISPEDLDLFRVIDSVEEAARRSRASTGSFTPTATWARASSSACAARCRRRPWRRSRCASPTS